MKAREVLDAAIGMLGYFDRQNELKGEGELSAEGLAAVKQIYIDLYYSYTRVTGENLEKKVPKTLNDTLNLPEAMLEDVMPYGVAMRIAENEGDGEKQQYYSVMYRQKRVISKFRNMECDRHVLPCDR